MTIQDFATLPEGELKEAIKELVGGFFECGGDYEWGYKEGHSLADIGFHKARALVEYIQTEISA